MTMKINVTRTETQGEPRRVAVDMVFDKGIGREDYDPHNDLQEFEENGLHGLKTPQGEIVYPAEYDAIHKWPDSDVIYTLKGKEYHYYNTAGEEILTDIPDVGISDTEEDLMPWFITEEQHRPYVIIIRPVEGPVGARCCLYRGQWVELDRIARKDVKKIMKTDTARFDNYFSYIYSGYEVKSNDKENPILDCIKKIRSLGCYQSSWAYLTRVCVSPQDSASERENVIMLSMLQFDALTPLNLDDLHCLSFGVDESLVKGEVKVTQIHYFHDRWPLDEEFSYERAIIEGTLEDVTATRAAALDAIRESANKECLRDALLDFPRDKCIPTEIYKSEDWKETLRKLDWLKSMGYTIEAGIYDLVGALYRECGYLSRFTPTKDAQQDWMARMLWEQGVCEVKRKKRKFSLDFGQSINLVKWFVSNGDNINILRGTKTPLDNLLSLKKAFEEQLSKASRKDLDELIDAFKALGARVSKEFIESIGAENVVGYAYPWIDKNELY